MGDDRLRVAYDISILSGTEALVLEAFARAQTRRETAKLLELSPRTVGRALTTAKEKLGARSPAEAAIIYELAR